MVSLPENFHEIIKNCPKKPSEKMQLAVYLKLSVRKVLLQSERITTDGWRFSLELLKSELSLEELLQFLVQGSRTRFSGGDVFSVLPPREETPGGAGEIVW